MNTSLRLFILTVSLLASVGAHADTLYIDIPKKTSAPPPKVTRAQVAADMHMLRLSGMSKLTVRQRSEQYGMGYEKTRARYDALIASPQFSELASELAKNPKAEVRAR